MEFLLNLIIRFMVKVLKFPLKPEKNANFINMIDTIESLNGLVFDISFYDNEWVAECRNLKGIVTGGERNNNSVEKLEENIKDAVFSAFGVPAYLCNGKYLVKKENKGSSNSQLTIRPLCLQ